MIDVKTKESRNTVRETKSCFFGKAKKLVQSLARLKRKKKEDITKITNVGGATQLNPVQRK